MGAFGSVPFSLSLLYRTRSNLPLPNFRRRMRARLVVAALALAAAASLSFAPSAYAQEDDGLEQQDYAAEEAQQEEGGGPAGGPPPGMSHEEMEAVSRQNGSALWPRTGAGLGCRIRARRAWSDERMRCVGESANANTRRSN